VVSAALRQRAWGVAAAVRDPEIPVLTIEELGVLRAVRVEGQSVEVVITPTYTGCPAMDAIAADIQAALAGAGIAGRVSLTLSPAWTTDWMSAEGRRKLAEYGIAPPTREPVACPRCGAREVEMLSAFGSTACKALWRCLACREPFDVFKCH
jgi:ring-1,2-phenylacetyl-CoA epoxidase subunit PaaD